MSTYAEKVNSLVDKVDPETGKLPDDIQADEALQFAVITERRRRDTQSSYTKGQQQLKVLELENSKLTEGWQADVVNTLSDSDKARMEELKVQDPEAWRQELAKIEEQNSTTFKEKRETISKEASEMTELERREADLAEYNEANPDLPLTDDVIANDIPPRIVNKLRNGESTFKEFLEEAKKYITTPKKIDTGETVKNEPNFANARGGSEPTDEANANQSSADYKNEVY